MAMMSHNLFLKIISKEIPAKIVHEDDLCMAFHDVNPQAPIHILIIPKQVIRTHADIVPGDAALLGHLHIVAAMLAKHLGIQAGYRLVINCEELAGQTVQQLHMHLLGGRNFAWPPG